jgi:hypothetical protein
MVGTMKQRKFKPGDDVQLPDGSRGRIVAVMPIGELEIYVKKVGYVFHYPEDLQPIPKKRRAK